MKSNKINQAEMKRMSVGELKIKLIRATRLLTIKSRNLDKAIESGSPSVSDRISEIQELTDEIARIRSAMEAKANGETTIEVGMKIRATCAVFALNDRSASIFKGDHFRISSINRSRRAGSKLFILKRAKKGAKRGTKAGDVVIVETTTPGMRNMFDNI